jgi:hypothetical protein
MAAEKYIYLKEGDILQNGDEYDSGHFVIGDYKRTLWPRAGMPCPKEILCYKPRRKVKLESDRKFNNLIVDEE